MSSTQPYDPSQHGTITGAASSECGFDLYAGNRLRRERETIPIAVRMLNLAPVKETQEPQPIGRDLAGLPEGGR